MRYVRFSLDKLRTILFERGMRERDLVVKMYGKESHQTFNTIFTKQFGVQKLIDVCNVLDIPMDLLFECKDDNAIFPHIQGNNNNINSTVINTDIASLKSENESLKLLIKEKNSRIADLNRNLDKVIELAQLGHHSDR